MTWIFFWIKLLQTALKLPFLINVCPLNVTERAEGLIVVYK